MAATVKQELQMLDDLSFQDSCFLPELEVSQKSPVFDELLNTNHQFNFPPFHELGQVALNGFQQGFHFGQPPQTPLNIFTPLADYKTTGLERAFPQLPMPQQRLPDLVHSDSSDSIDSFLASEEELLLSENICLRTSKRKRQRSDSNSVSSCSVVSNESSQKKQKRTKWKDEEVVELWQGIALHGNNWREIKKSGFADRTYYQVKDKGRRILASKGWSSGRTKATHDGASDDARMIAEKFLQSVLA